MWRLSQRWYGDRLDEDYAPRSVGAAQQLLDDVGMTAAFWQLAPR